MEQAESGFSVGIMLWQLLLLGIVGLVVYVVVKLIRKFKK
ncbi:MAG: hypothetical protein RL427_1227 [Bacteroidota bacterium]|jgi:flagellar biogenesis protein FliO